MQHPGYGTGVNTEQWAPYVTPDTLNVYIAFSGTYTMAQVDIENFNPFIIINKNRDDEVHLPDYPPTDLANTWQFGHADDDSDAGSNRYYKTETNLPWAINIPEPFDYPKERLVITSAHLKFAEWAEGDGVLSPDWYKDLPGYRNNSMIYDQP
jgi:LruC domain-containing protein